MISRYRVARAVPLGLVAAIVIGTAWVAALPAGAQEPQAAAPEPTPVPEPTPIPASKIPAQAGEVSALVREIGARLQPKEGTTAISDGLAAIEGRIGDYQEFTASLLETDGSAEILKDARSEIGPVSVKLAGWATDLGRRTAEIEGDLTRLQETRELWKLTATEAGETGLPAALVEQVNETLETLDAAVKETEARRNEVLTLQARVATSQTRLNTMESDLRKEIGRRQRNLFRLDSPPLWKAARQDDPHGELGDEIAARFGRRMSEVKSYLRDHPGRPVLHVLLVIGLVVLFVWLRGKAELWVQSDRSMRTATELLQRPLAASLLVTILLLDGWVYPDAPAALLSLLNVLLIPVVPSLLRRMLRPELRPGVWAFVVVAVIYLLVEYVPTTYFLDRIGQLVLALAGCVVCVWLVRQLSTHQPRTATRWYRAGILGLRIAASLFAVSIVANVIGAVALASYLVTATLGSAYQAIVVWVLAAVLLSAISVLLRTTPAKRLRIVRYDADNIRTATFRLVRFLAVAAWVVFTLDAFGFLDDLTAAARRVLDFQLKLGELSLSVSSVAVFILVVWLSHKISQALSYVLGEDVLPRLDLPRGAPAAISKVTQYLVVTLGFLIAVTAAGFDLSQLTIVVGALSVGIGFGLQNIVNNFVSGLILLFERPINLGDKIEIGQISGVIQDIGIRASVVRTWSGADVVVPNATLISDNVVNWTLNDPSRRMEIPVGVAYGSDPKQVIELLLGIADDHQGVLDHPPPAAIFTGFGDSALIFELRAWTTGDFVTIASDLRVEIDRAAKAAGIEIPFPQRDLHLRSVDGGAAAALSGRERPPRRRPGDDPTAAMADPTGSGDAAADAGEHQESD